MPPLHIGPPLDGPVDDGVGLTVAMVVNTVVGLQPALLTVSEYVIVPVTVGVSIGFCNVEVNPSDPVHE